MPRYGTRYSNKKANRLNEMDRETQELATAHRNRRRQADRDPGPRKPPTPAGRIKAMNKAVRKKS